jgi:hypothetical protein
MISPKMRALAFKVSSFASSHGIRLTEDDALDVTGHLLCDDMMDVAEKDPPDWHCILWNRDEAATGEVYSLCRSAPVALAAIKNHAADEQHDLDDEVEVEGPVLNVYSNGKLYARIRRPEWVAPSPTTYRRMATLVSPMRIWEEQRLREALSTLPAWQVEQYNRYRTWFPDRQDVERRGEWLPRLSANETADAPLEQNLLPLWPTPNAMAATLHQQLSERAAGRLKLAHCQEGLATILGVGSWQVLLARFRAYSFPQVTMQTLADEDAEPGIRFYKGPVELLAWTYDLALQRKATGASPLYVQVQWLNSFRLALTHQLQSRADLHQAVSAKCTVPSELSGEESVRWDAVTRGVSEEAQEWRDYGFGLDELGASDEDTEFARQELIELGYS